MAAINQAAPGSAGYRSGRSSWRVTRPSVARSMSITRSAGIRFAHLVSAPGVTSSAAASFALLPRICAARSSAVFEAMVAILYQRFSMSSTGLV